MPSGTPLARTVTIVAGGTGTITIRPTGDRPWSITQVSVELSSAPVGATCDVRRNGFLVSPLIPTGDAASGDPAVTLFPEDDLTVNWTGCTVGTVAKALVFYEQVGR